MLLYLYESGGRRKQGDQKVPFSPLNFIKGAIIVHLSYINHPYRLTDGLLIIMTELKKANKCSLRRENAIFDDLDSKSFHIGPPTLTRLLLPCFK